MLQPSEKSLSIPLKLHTLVSPQLHADRLIVATNRGPVEYYLGQDNELKHRRGAGGVVTAMRNELRLPPTIPIPVATMIAVAIVIPVIV